MVGGTRTFLSAVPLGGTNASKIRIPRPVLREPGRCGQECPRSEILTVLSSRLLSSRNTPYWHRHRKDFIPLRVFKVNDKLDIAQTAAMSELEGATGMPKVKRRANLFRPKIQQAVVAPGASIL